MAKPKLGARLGAACASMMLTVTLATAQSYPPDQSRTKPNRGGNPATAPAASDAAQATTINGCVVRDAANGGSPTIKANGIWYKLASKANDDFAAYLGKRVEVVGVIGPAPAQRATSGKPGVNGTGADSVAPPGQTAVGGQSDVTATGTPRDNTVPNATPPDAAAGASRNSIPLATDKGTTADLTRALQVKSIRTVAGSCL